MKAKGLFLIILFFSFVAFSQNVTEIYIAQFSSLAVEQMRRFQIPASITLAQGILESGSGESRLAKEGNNHFGIKCHNTWNGATIFEDDDQKGECFRKYPTVADSYQDHSLFLTQRERYAFLFDYSISDYKHWAKGLKNAGYATNPNYPELLIDLIEKYQLYRLDEQNEQSNQFYLAHSYGLPFLYGIGVCYFQNKHLYLAELNTSFVFGNANVGIEYALTSNLYTGLQSGIIYLPAKSEDIIPYVAAELTYNLQIKDSKNLIRTGVQLPLKEMDFKFIPYLQITFLSGK